MDLYSGAGHIAKQLEPDISQKCIMVDSSSQFSYLQTEGLQQLNPSVAEGLLHRDPDEQFEGLLT